MIYPRGINRSGGLDGKKRRRFSVIAIAVFFLSVFIIILGWTGLGGELAGFFDFVIYPIFKAEKALTSLSSLTSFSFSKQDFQKENLRLEESLKRSEALILNQQKILDENTKLKETLGRFENKKLLLGEVLAKPNRSPYDTILIDLGLRDGVEKAAMVLSYGEIPIGRVEEVREKTSLIRLFSSPGQSEYVEIGENKIPATAIGQGAGNFRVILPKDTAVSEGNEVTIPGISPNVIGYVERVIQSDTETFSHIFFKSNSNIYQLSKVFIIEE